MNELIVPPNPALETAPAIPPAPAVHAESLPMSNRKEFKDRRCDRDYSNEKWDNLLLTRLVAKGRKFVKVNFKYTIFDTCYLRGCRFEDCDFTGCRFVACNMHGAIFVGCNFDYTTFERTLVDENILNEGCPGSENIRMRFARSLRMNYQQIGDAIAVNKAVKTELEATGTHLSKAVWSRESYYRKKYNGLERFFMWLKLLNFRFLDFAWGNGESLIKLFRSICVFLIIIFVIDMSYQDNIDGIYQSALRAPQIFLGVNSPGYIPGLWLAFFVFVRLVVFGMFTAILVRRFSRR